MKQKKEIKTETTPTDAEKDGLKGAVNIVMQITYKAHQRGGETVQGKIQCDSLWSNQNLIRTYDEKGRKLKEQLFGKDGGNAHVYNENGRVVDLVQTDKGGAVKQTTSHTYNAKGGSLGAVARDADGKIIYQTVVEYRDDGRPISNIHYSGEAKDRIISKTLHEFDERGNETSVTQYSVMASPDYKTLAVSHQTLNKYNEKNQKIEQVNEFTSKTMPGRYSKFTYKYNEQGDVIETSTYHENGSLKDTYYSTPEYDSEGKRIIPKPVPYVLPKAEGETEEMVNDEHGNWIKKTTFYNKLPVSIYVRELVYFGEPAKTALPFIHPLTLTTDVEETKEPMEELTDEEAKWLVEATNSTPDNFSILRYYTMRFREAPSLVAYTGPHIEAYALLNELKENMDAQEIYSYSTVWNNYGEQLVRYTLSFPGKNYLFHASHISAQNDDEFEVPENINKKSRQYGDTGHVYVSQFHLLRPGDASGKRDESFEEELNEYIVKCSLKKKPDKPVINMIEVNANGFAMKEHPVDDNFEIKDLDVNYGSGFEKFHHDLMQRFSKSSKGLVLFHGHPGTGKTYYIRHLLRSMASKKKVVIYMPPNMVDHLVEPSFMTFLSGEIQDWSNDGQFCVLLIEDAEPLLAKRQEGVRIQGVTNLLNMTDGLLNDMLNLQIICTFNVDLKKLDSALLRPGRLIARKEFKALSELDANLLASRLGIKHHFTRPATLGEIYAMRKDSNTLIHDVESDRGASTIIDDF